MEKKVYVVTRGSYSDYSIVAIFDNLEQAQALAARGNNNPEVEEYKLNPQYVDYGAQGYCDYTVDMLADGTTVLIRRENSDLYIESEDFQERKEMIRVWAMRYCKEYQKLTYPILDKHPYFMRGYIFAKSEEHAIKIVNEKRIQLLAENRFMRE